MVRSLVSRYLEKRYAGLVLALEFTLTRYYWSSGRMKPDFDMTMDSLLRQQGRRAQARPVAAELSTDGAHLDADEMNAYAENALPSAARSRYVAHLADCTPCRQTVTQLALAAGLAFQEEAAVAATAVKPPTLAATETAQTARSWRDWFTALLNPAVLRYAAPAVILLAVTVGAFIALRPAKQSADTVQVARNTEEPQDTQQVTSNAAAPVPSATMSLKPDAPPLAGVTPAPVAPSATVAAPGKPPEVVVNQKPAKDADTAKEKVPAREQPELRTSKNEGRADDSKGEVAGLDAPAPRTVTVVPLIVPPAPPALAQRARNMSNINGLDKTDDAPTDVTITVEDESKRKINKSTVANANGPNKSGQASAGASATRRAAPAAKKPSQEAAAERDATPVTRIVNGRTFTQRNGAWIDQACANGCSTTTLRRGSDDYKKADAGLRSIADQLSGTVIIVWQGKAYRIH